MVEKASSGVFDTVSNWFNSAETAAPETATTPSSPVVEPAWQGPTLDGNLPPADNYTPASTTPFFTPPLPADVDASKIADQGMQSFTVADAKKPGIYSPLDFVDDLGNKIKTSVEKGLTAYGETAAVDKAKIAQAEQEAEQRRAGLENKLQAHAQSGLFTPETATQFGLSQEQVDKFFVFGKDDQGQNTLAYTDYLKQHPAVQDEKLFGVGMKLDQRQATDTLRQQAETAYFKDVDEVVAGNMPTESKLHGDYYTATADYLQGKTEHNPAMMNRGEVGLNNFLRDSDPQKIGEPSPELAAMRESAQDLTREIGLGKVEELRRLDQLQASGTEIYSSPQYQQVAESNHTRRAKDLDAMESDLKNGKVATFDQAVDRRVVDRMDPYMRQWISFHVVEHNPDLTASAERDDWPFGRKAAHPILPPVSERTTPEKNQAAYEKFSQDHGSNSDGFVDQQISHDGLAASPEITEAMRAYDDEEKFVADYKQNMLAGLQSENNPPPDYLEVKDSFTEKRNYHNKLQHFVKDNQRDDLRFPQNPSPNNKPEDYDAALEAMGRQAFAQHQVSDERRVGLIDDPNLSAADRAQLNRYREEFDPTDEWFNLRRGTDHVIAREGSIIAADTLAGMGFGSVTGELTADLGRAAMQGAGQWGMFRYPGLRTSVVLAREGVNLTSNMAGTAIGKWVKGENAGVQDYAVGATGLVDERFGTALGVVTSVGDAYQKYMKGVTEAEANLRNETPDHTGPIKNDE